MVLVFGTIPLSAFAATGTVPEGGQVQIGLEFVTLKDNFLSAQFGNNLQKFFNYYLRNGSIPEETDADELGATNNVTNKMGSTYAEKLTTLKEKLSGLYNDPISDIPTSTSLIWLKVKITVPATLISSNGASGWQGMTLALEDTGKSFEQVGGFIYNPLINRADAWGTGASHDDGMSGYYTTLDSGKPTVSLMTTETATVGGNTVTPYMFNIGMGLSSTTTPWYNYPTGTDQLDWDLLIPLKVKSGAEVGSDYEIKVATTPTATYNSMMFQLSNGANGATYTAGNSFTKDENVFTGSTTYNLTDPTKEPTKPALTDVSDTTYVAADNKNIPYVSSSVAEGSDTTAYNDTITFAPQSGTDAGGTTVSTTGFYFGDYIKIYKNKDEDDPYDPDNPDTTKLEYVMTSQLSEDNALSDITGLGTITTCDKNGDEGTATRADNVTFRLFPVGTDDKYYGASRTATDNLGALHGEITANTVFYVARLGAGTGRTESVVKVPVKMTTAETTIYYTETKDLTDGSAIEVEYGASMSDVLDILEAKGVDTDEMEVTVENGSRDVTMSWESDAFYNKQLDTSVQDGTQAQPILDSGDFIRHGTYTLVNDYPTETEDGITYEAADSNTTIASSYIHTGAEIEVKVKPKASDYTVYGTDDSGSYKLNLSGFTQENLTADDRIFIYSGEDVDVVTISEANKGNSNFSISSPSFTLSAGNTVKIKYRHVNDDSASEAITVTVVDGTKPRVSANLEINDQAFLADETWSDLLNHLNDDVTFKVTGPLDGNGNLMVTEVPMTAEQLRTLGNDTDNNGLAIKNTTKDKTVTLAEFNANEDKTVDDEYQFTFNLPNFTRYKTLTGTTTEYIAGLEAKIQPTTDYTDGFTNGTAYSGTATSDKVFTVNLLGTASKGLKLSSGAVAKITTNAPYGAEDVMTITGDTRTDIRNNLDSAIFVLKNKDTGETVAKSKSGVTMTVNAENENARDYTVPFEQVGYLDDGTELVLVLACSEAGYVTLPQTYAVTTIPEEYVAYEVVQPSPASLEITKGDLATVDKAGVFTYLSNNATGPKIRYGRLKDRGDGTAVFDTDTLVEKELPSATFGYGAVNSYTVSPEIAEGTESTISLKTAELADVETAWTLYYHTEDGTVTGEKGTDGVLIHVDYGENTPYNEGGKAIKGVEFTQKVTVVTSAFNDEPAKTAIDASLSVTNNPYPAKDTVTVTDKKTDYEGVTLHLYANATAATNEGVTTYSSPTSPLGVIELGKTDGSVTIALDNDKLSYAGGQIYYTLTQAKVTKEEDDGEGGTTTVTVKEAQGASAPAPVTYAVEPYVAYGTPTVDPTLVKMSLDEAKADVEGASTDAEKAEANVRAKLPTTATVTGVHLKSDGTANGVEPIITGDNPKITVEVNLAVANEKIGWFKKDTTDATVLSNMNTTEGGTYEIYATYAASELDGKKAAITDGEGNTVGAKIVGEVYEYNAVSGTDSALYSISDAGYNKTEIVTVKLTTETTPDPTDIPDNIEIAVTLTTDNTADPLVTAKATLDGDDDTITYDPTDHSAENRLQMDANATNDQLTIGITGDSSADLKGYELIVKYKGHQSDSTANYLKIDGSKAFGSGSYAGTANITISSTGIDSDMKADGQSIVNTDTWATTGDTGDSTLDSVKTFESTFSGFDYSGDNTVSVYLHKTGEALSTAIPIYYAGVKTTTEIGKDTQLTTLHLTAESVTAMVNSGDKDTILGELLVYAGYADRTYADSDTDHVYAPTGYADKSSAATVPAYDSKGVKITDVPLEKSGDKIVWKLQTSTNGGAWTDDTTDVAYKNLQKANYVKEKDSATGLPKDGVEATLTGGIEYRLAAEMKPESSSSAENNSNKVAFIEIKVYNAEDHPMQLKEGNSDVYNYDEASYDNSNARTFAGPAREELAKQMKAETGTTYTLSSAAERTESKAFRQRYKNDLIFYYKADAYTGGKFTNVSDYIDKADITLNGTVLSEEPTIDEIPMSDDGYGLSRAQLYSGHIEPTHSSTEAEYFSPGVSVTRGEEYYRMAYTVEEEGNTYVAVRRVLLTYQRGDADLNGLVLDNDRIPIAQLIYGTNNVKQELMVYNEDTVEQDGLKKKGERNENLNAALLDVDGNGKALDNDSTAIAQYIYGASPEVKRLYNVRFIQR